MHSAGGRRGQMEGRWTPTVNELSNHADFHAARFDLPVYGVRANTNDAHGLLLDYISRNTFISALTSTPRRRLSVKKYLFFYTVQSNKPWKAVEASVLTCK